MKKIHLIFGLTAVAVIVIGTIHGGIAWIVAEVTWDPLATSFPTWGAFVLPLLFYSVGAGAVLLAWLIAWLVIFSRKKGIAKRRSE